MVPDSWRTTPIAAVSNVVRGASPRPAGSPLYFNGDYLPWITVAEVTRQSGPYIASTNSALTQEGSKFTRIIPSGTLILTNSGATLGVPKITCMEAGANDGIAALFLKEGIAQQFMYYWLESRTKYLREVIAPGVGQPNLNTELIGSLLISLPPLPEQERIAEILSTWDRAIETTEKLLASAEAQKRALMQQLLTGKRRLKGFKLSEWPRASLHSVFERVRRKNSKGNGNVLTISGKNGLVSQLDYFSKIVASSDTADYTLIQGEEFAYNKSYSAGYPLGAIKMLPAGQNGVLSSLYICFSVRDAEYDSSRFYQHWFEFGSLNRELRVVAQEGARNHGLLNVGIADFFDLQIVRPSHKEQLAIAEVLDGADVEIRLLDKQVRNLREQKKALMQQLLTGKRRVAV